MCFLFLFPILLEQCLKALLIQVANRAVAVLPPSGNSDGPVISLNAPFKFYSFIRLKVLGN